MHLFTIVDLQFAIEIATKAIKCAKTLKTLAKNSMEPIYFFSDSNDLVNYMAFQVQNASQFKTKLGSEISNISNIELDAMKVTYDANIVARKDVSFMENAHIDKQKGRDAPAYYGTFVDLFLAIYARCITFGVGNYALLAIKISGTSCKLLYEEEAWGGNEKKRLHTSFCVL